LKVLLATIGTRGDVQPFVALALGLRARGHAVAIATCPRFAPMLEAQEIPLLPLDEGLLELLDTPAGRAMLGGLDGVAGILRTIPKVLRSVGPIHRRLVADAWAATEAFAPHVVVHHPKLFCMPAFAARRGIAALLALFVPMLVPTGESPLPGLPRLPLGRGYNRATWHALRLALRAGSASYVRAWRRRHDPEGLSRGATPLRLGRGRPLPVLHAYGTAVCPAPGDWPPEATVTGYWCMPASGWTPPPALAAFLASGPPPVYVGFGSMAGVDPAATTRIVLDALARAGVRAVLAKGWGGIAAHAVPASVFLLDDAPHDALFPRMAAVVHHGGAGTTAAGLRAGRPTVVCPFAVDQPFWGARVHALGAGPAPLPQRRLDAARLGDAIRRAVDDPTMLGAAQRIGAALRAEDGVAAAIARIEAAMR
jgi:sterol 3beta-glucosyltransferase